MFFVTGVPVEYHALLVDASKARSRIVCAANFAGGVEGHPCGGAEQQYRCDDAGADSAAAHGGAGALSLSGMQDGTVARFEVSV